MRAPVQLLVQSLLAVSVVGLAGLATTGCNLTSSKAADEAPYTYQFFDQSQAGLEPTSEYDFRVVVDADVLPDKKELAQLTNYILAHNDKGRIDTLFYYLPEQLVLLGSYGYAEVKDGELDEIKLNGDRALICSDWHPFIKANDRRCDIYESEYTASDYLRAASQGIDLDKAPLPEPGTEAASADQEADGGGQASVGTEELPTGVSQKSYDASRRNEQLQRDKERAESQANTDLEGA
ncbi:MAG: hypothetical protein KC474_00975 [Cyanobacteria bacterium HKST-UBA04]|nr:hypothetical protein [Cyanobacteria bacterium HKST-UBA05]MCA9798094.1 hypothetical protein [Cyanobacteria bacterium HKST-UBA04]MCA9841784.1 hypothetical protein [Cyanobacteria bacterium HKST-UBA03]